MAIKFRSYLALGAGIFLAACSSPKDANEDNYMAAIQEYFDGRDDFPHCVFRYNFPLEGNEQQLRINGLQKPLDILTELGLLNHKSEDLAAKAAKFGRKLGYGAAKTMNSYTLTEAGEQYYIPERGICIGRAKLLSLSEVSKPYEERGRTLVRGQYLWTIELPNWAMESKFYDSGAFSTDLYYLKYEKLLKEEPFSDFFTLTLKDEGWGF